MRVDQWVPAAHRGDAIGDESLRIRDLLRESGYEADVFALQVDDDAVSEVLSFESRPVLQSSDLVILHYALPSIMSAEFAQCQARKMLIYHNITPHQFFRWIRR